jgi:hypothetical protein
MTPWNKSTNNRCRREVIFCSFGTSRAGNEAGLYIIKADNGDVEVVLFAARLPTIDPGTRSGPSSSYRRLKRPRRQRDSRLAGKTPQ